MLQNRTRNHALTGCVSLFQFFLFDTSPLSQPIALTRFTLSYGRTLSLFQNWLDSWVKSRFVESVLRDSLSTHHLFYHLPASGKFLVVYLLLNSLFFSLELLLTLCYRFALSRFWRRCRYCSPRPSSTSRCFNVDFYSFQIKMLRGLRWLWFEGLTSFLFISVLSLLHFHC